MIALIRSLVLAGTAYIFSVFVCVGFNVFWVEEFAGHASPTGAVIDFLVADVAGV